MNYNGVNSTGGDSVSLIPQTMQNIYDNSTEPHITTNADTFVIKSGEINQRTFQIYDNNDSRIAYISSLGLAVFRELQIETGLANMRNGLSCGQIAALEDYKFPINNLLANNGDGLFYNLASRELEFNRQRSLYTHIITTGIDASVDETDLMVTGSPLKGIRIGSQLIINLSGVISVPISGPSILNLKVYLCDTFISFPINIPNGVTLLNHFDAQINIIFRTIGSSASTYAFGRFEYMTDSINSIKILEEIGFPTIDTTDITNNLRVTGQFNLAFTGLNIFVRGGSIDYK